MTADESKSPLTSRLSEGGGEVVGGTAGSSSSGGSGSGGGGSGGGESGGSGSGGSSSAAEKKPSSSGKRELFLSNFISCW